jgi:hypothetical protein
MRTLFTIASLLLASTSFAANYAGHQVFIPVVTHVAGANGTQWRTDVVISSRHASRTTTVGMVYDPVDRIPVVMSMTLGPRESVTITDFVGDRAGTPGSFGTLTLTTDSEDVPIVAFARVYNTGNAAGEFGQLIQGMPPSELSRMTWLNGLIGIRGFRTNVGIANPHGTATSFWLTWYDKQGDSHGGAGMVTVPPYGLLLYNDIFNVVGMPPDEGLSLSIDADLPLYAYASVVRNDTGDAYTIMGDGRE